jgi:hypothetical protein
VSDARDGQPELSEGSLLHNGSWSWGGSGLDRSSSGVEVDDAPAADMALDGLAAGHEERPQSRGLRALIPASCS